MDRLGHKVKEDHQGQQASLDHRDKGDFLVNQVVRDRKEHQVNPDLMGREGLLDQSEPLANQDHEDPQGKLVPEAHQDQLALLAQQDHKDQEENRVHLVKWEKKAAVDKPVRLVRIDCKSFLQISDLPLER